MLSTSLHFGSVEIFLPSDARGKRLPKRLLRLKTTSRTLTSTRRPVLHRQGLSGPSEISMPEFEQRDSDQPIYHVMPRDGWLNGNEAGSSTLGFLLQATQRAYDCVCGFVADPNGPIYFSGRYHM